MSKQISDTLGRTTDTKPRPFVRPGEEPGYVTDLKKRGQWPPRLPDRDKGNDRKVTTPYLVVLNSATDIAAPVRPLSPGKAFHAKFITLIDDTTGNPVSEPVAGGSYRIRCRIKNFGAYPAYAGMIEFYIDKPANFTAAAGTTAHLPIFSHKGFTALQGETVEIQCPRLWTPATAADLQNGILVQAYDLASDKIASRFDAVNDRHVGRHDFTSDFYVRDWTDSPALHDKGQEPSANPVFYRTSDVWNQRSNHAPAFNNDQPVHEEPQAGDGPAGDNFLFARISRNTSGTQETVSAHFLVAEFGTGSPFAECTPPATASVTFAVGETTKIVSAPWHLHPTSSNHLCMAVELTSDGDPLGTSLLGHTPGWPTTDQMVTNDNNKAQRNTQVWNGVAAAHGMAFGIVFNASFSVRDMNLLMALNQSDMQLVRNPMVQLAGGEAQPFKSGALLTLKRMMPGETRLVSFSYDGLSLKEGQSVPVLFNELVGRQVVNGYALELRAASTTDVLRSVLERHQSVLARMQDGFGIGGRGLEQLKPLLKQPSIDAYAKSRAALAEGLAASINDLAKSMTGKNLTNVSPGDKELANLVAAGRQLTTIGDPTKALVEHSLLLVRLDGWLTTVLKNRGDEAAIPFTLRLQLHLGESAQVRRLGGLEGVMAQTANFLADYQRRKVSAKDYPLLVRPQLDALKALSGKLGSDGVRKALDTLAARLGSSPALLQRAHLDFLNAVLQAIGEDQKP